KTPASRCSLPRMFNPKGLRNKAQGCEERATLGKVTDDSQPQRGCGMVLFPWSPATTLSGLSAMWRAFSQGSSFLATLGFVAESLWDSALWRNALKDAGKVPRLAGTFACPCSTCQGLAGKVRSLSHPLNK